ncbi:MAG: hypothetical protein JWQ02_4236 [Capsulimonas sp.]|jgi:hypothetical protein|nr:hypothetical protein [Capsulimonas sp.]
MKPRTIAAGAFVAMMLISGGVVLRHFQVKHPPRLKGEADRDFRDSHMGGPRNWRMALPTERKDAIACIGGQLDAFKKDDYNKAMAFQSAMLRSQFRSPNMFRTIIRQNYPEFSNSKTVEYKSAFASKNGQMMAMELSLTGVNGKEVHALYRLIREKNGYRVMGVENQ